VFHGTLIATFVIGRTTPITHGSRRLTTLMHGPRRRKISPMLKLRRETRLPSHIMWSASPEPILCSILHTEGRRHAQAGIRRSPTRRIQPVDVLQAADRRVYGHDLELHHIALSVAVHSRDGTAW